MSDETTTENSQRPTGFPAGFTELDDDAYHSTIAYFVTGFVHEDADIELLVWRAPSNHEGEPVLEVGPARIKKPFLLEVNPGDDGAELRVVGEDKDNLLDEARRLAYDRLLEDLPDSVVLTSPT